MRLGLLLLLPFAVKASTPLAQALSSSTCNTTLLFKFASAFSSLTLRYRDDLKEMNQALADFITATQDQWPWDNFDPAEAGAWHELEMFTYSQPEPQS